ncbi:MAG: hypothetical protein ACK559_09015, partial [bacterium]
MQQFQEGVQRHHAPRRREGENVHAGVADHGLVERRRRREVGRKARRDPDGGRAQGHHRHRQMPCGQPLRP